MSYSYSHDDEQQGIDTMSSAAWTKHQQLKKEFCGDNASFLLSNPEYYRISLEMEMRNLAPTSAHANDIVFYYIQLSTLFEEASSIGFEVHAWVQMITLLCGISEYYPEFRDNTTAELDNAEGEAEIVIELRDLMTDLEAYVKAEFGSGVDNKIFTPINAYLPRRRRDDIDQKNVPRTIRKMKSKSHVLDLNTKMLQKEAENSASIQSVTEQDPRPDWLPQKSQQSTGEQSFQKINRIPETAAGAKSATNLFITQPVPEVVSLRGAVQTAITPTGVTNVPRIEVLESVP